MTIVSLMPLVESCKDGWIEITLKEKCRIIITSENENTYGVKNYQYMRLQQPEIDRETDSDMKSSNGRKLKGIDLIG